MNNIKLKCKRCGFPIHGTVYSVDGFDPYCYECNLYLRNCSHSASSIATVLFVGLKLTDNIDWSWWWVLSPLLFWFGVFVSLIAAKVFVDLKGL